LYFCACPGPASGARLTPRELQVLTALASGAASAEIARSLKMSPNTVRTHVQNVLGKLGVHSKLEAVTRPSAQGW
jgi:DNA-binding NarL/FixJ family response regulator